LPSALPNLIIVGAMKAGTSALHTKLALHPQIQMSEPKELDFFLSADDLTPDRALELRRSLRWDRGLDWYTGHFDPDALVRGESSPGYTSPEHHGAAARIASVIPDVKLIFLTRDPVGRSVSQYRHRVLEGNEHRPIDVALRDQDSGYLVRSKYHYCLRPFLDDFDRSQIKLIAQEGLLSNPRTALEDVYHFLGVDAGYWSVSQAERTYETQSRRSQSTLVPRLRSLPLEQRIEDALPRSVIELGKKFLSRPTAPGEIDSTPSSDTIAFLREYFAADQEALRRLISADPAT
jgi:hypothetical protein